MSIETRIKDGKGSGHAATVDIHKSLVTTYAVPALAESGTENRIQYFRSTTSGLNVNGATTPVITKLAAAQDYDIFITKIIIRIEDSKVKEEEYGDVGPLANGVDLYSSESGSINYIVQGAINFTDLKAQGGDPLAEPKAKTSGAEVALVNIQITDYIPGGIRLGKQSLDHVAFVINDDLTGLTEHIIYFQGYKHIA